MASPVAGDYRVVPVIGPTLSLDVHAGSVKDGANIQVYTSNNTEAQMWQLSYRKDGTAQLLNRRVGKSIDIRSGNVASGTNVQLWTDNDSRAQTWSIQSDGGSATYQGTTFPTYTIRPSVNSGLSLDVSGGKNVSGANVWVYTTNNTDAQRWMFVPIAPFSSGGTYELRSMLKTSMAVDVSGASSVRGANVQLYSANHSNAQVFYVTEEADGWSVENVSSGMYLDVAAGSAKSGTNVQQWDDNDTRAQRWVLTSYGTTLVDGVECAVVSLGSKVDGTGTGYMMDVKNALTTNSANVQIYAANGTNAQRFALFPARPRETSLPAPANMGWSVSVGDPDYTRERPEAETYYPTWETTKAWASDSANHHEWRYRRRSLDAQSSTWSAFTDWTPWEVAAVTVSGTRVWVTEGVQANVPTGAKALQYEFQARAASPTDDGGTVCGLESAVTVQADLVPSVTLDAAGFGPEGLRLGYSSTYDSGTTNLSIESVTAGGKDVLKADLYSTGLDDSGSVLIPMRTLSRWLNDGEAIAVSYRVGTDQWATFEEVQEASLTVSYNAGYGVEATPTLAPSAGRTLTLTVPPADVTAAWIRQGDGPLVAMTLDNGSAIISPPFGSMDYEVFAAIRSTDGDHWGVAHLTAEECEAAITASGGSVRPCHAWTFDGGYFLLELQEGSPLETDYSVSREVGTYRLNDREWESVHYSPTMSGTFTAEGVLTDRVSMECTRDDLFALCKAGYAVYRSPHGMVADVAVTGFQLNEGYLYSTVSVSMTRVTN